MKGGLEPEPWGVSGLGLSPELSPQSFLHRLSCRALSVLACLAKCCQWDWEQEVASQKGSFTQGIAPAGKNSSQDAFKNHGLRAVKSVGTSLLFGAREQMEIDWAPPSPKTSHVLRSRFLCHVAEHRSAFVHGEL